MIAEWLPFYHYLAIASNPLHLLAGIAPLLGLAAVVLVVRQGKGLRLEVVLTALGLVLLPFRSARFVFFVAIAAVLMLPYLAALWPGMLRRWTIPAVLCTSLLILGTTIDYHSRVQFGAVANYLGSFKQDLDERRFPVEFDTVIASISAQRDRPLKIFCQPNWGGYLLYHHFPSVRVLADGRGNISEDLGTRLHFLYLHRHDPRYGMAVEQIYDESGADLLVMQNPVAPPGYALANWGAVAESPKGRVLMRK